MEGSETVFPLAVQRTRTASGWEWYLTVGGRRAYARGLSVGLFTSQGDGHPAPEEMLGRLLRQHAEAR